MGQNLSNLIEYFIKDLLNNEQEASITRRELALRFNCAPSQINYVLDTRFTRERGYIVESRRGGGGYVKICKISVPENHPSCLFRTLERCGEGYVFTQNEVCLLLLTMLENGEIGQTEFSLIKTAVSDNTLQEVPVMFHDSLRTRILQGCLLEIARNGNGS